MNKTKQDAGLTWGDIEIDVLGLSGVMATFAVLLDGIGLLSAPLALMAPIFRRFEKVANGIIGIVKNLVEISQTLKDAGGPKVLEKMVKEDIPPIIKGINKQNFDVEMSRKEMRELSKKYSDMASLILSVTTIVEAISKISQISGVIDDKGNIRSIKKINQFTGEITYGDDPVDIVNVASTTTGVVKTFVENLKFGFEEVQSMYNAQEIMRVIATMVDPVTKFVDMLTKYDSGGTETLCSIRFDEKGNPIKGDEINVVNVASAIAGSVSAFVFTLYDEKNVANWSQIIYGDRTFLQRFLGQKSNKAKSVSEVAGVFGAIIDPVCSFIDMVAGFNAENGMLTKIEFDEKGNVKKGGIQIDVKTIGGLISDTITEFISKIYGTANSIGDTDPDFVLKLFKPVDNIVKVAKDLSSKDISSADVITNSGAISGFIVSISSSLTAIQWINEDSIAMLGNIVKIGASMGQDIDGNKIIMNSKSIATFMTDVVEKKFPNGTENVDKFTKSVKNLKTAFSELDTVLIKEEEKRQKALDKFGESIKSLMVTLDGSKASIDSFKELIDTIQSIDLNKLDRITNFSGSGVSYQPAGGGGGETNVNVDQTVNQVSAGPALGKEDIQSAIEEAFRNIQIVQQGVPSFDVNGDGNIDEGDLMTFAFQ